MKKQQRTKRRARCTRALKRIQHLQTQLDSESSLKLIYSRALDIEESAHRKTGWHLRTTKKQCSFLQELLQEARTAEVKAHQFADRTLFITAPIVALAGAILATLSIKYFL